MRRTVGEEQILSVYRDTIEPFYRTVSRRCGGDRELAEDIVQETWLRAVRDWRAKGIPTRPIAWLTTVARNLLVNECRRRRSLRLERSGSAEEILASVPDGIATESADTAAVVIQALARLPARQAWLLEAFHLDGWRVAEIADALSISERAVEGRLRRARENLRRELEHPLNHRELSYE